MTRRLRLALLLAALVVSGPAPSVRAFETRLDVSIAWFCSERVVTPSRQHAIDAAACAEAERSGFHAHPAPSFRSALLSNSQFQRPPPVAN